MDVELEVVQWAAAAAAAVALAPQPTLTVGLGVSPDPPAGRRTAGVTQITAAPGPGLQNSC